MARLQPQGQGRRMSIAADFDLDRVRIGDSIAVNGACLTAVVLDGRRFDVDISPESLSKTTLGGLRIGSRVNLERALRLSDRLDGHLVSGHVDGLGELAERTTLANAIILRFTAPEELTRYMIRKGSIAVDGVSLTINECDDHGFSVSIIPHTAHLTSMGSIGVGDPVNLETDMIGKYVERFLLKGRIESSNETGGSPVTLELLARQGFLK